jgi:hypothetical protein
MIIIGNSFSMECSDNSSARPHRSFDARPEWNTLYIHDFAAILIWRAIFSKGKKLIEDGEADPSTASR